MAFEWSEVNLPASCTWGPIAYGSTAEYGSMFVVLSQSTPQYATSFDGVNWMLAALPYFAACAWASITAGNNIFLAVPATVPSPPITCATFDGRQWTFKSSLSVSAAFAVCFGAYATTGAWVASASPGLYAKLSQNDGDNWYTSSWHTDPSVVTDIAFGNGVFIGVGGSSVQRSTTGGITWEHITSTATDAQCVAYGEGLFVSLGFTETPSNGCDTSIDGVNWSHHTTSLPYVSWNAIAYGAALGMFVTVGSTMPFRPVNSPSNTGISIAATSTDGVTWSLSTMPATKLWFDVAYGNGVFVAIPNDPDNNVAAVYGATGAGSGNGIAIGSADGSSYSIALGTMTIGAMGPTGPLGPTGPTGAWSGSDTVTATAFSFGAGGPNLTTGVEHPTALAPAGSLYLCSGGGADDCPPTLWISNGSAWFWLLSGTFNVGSS